MIKYTFFGLILVLSSMATADISITGVDSSSTSGIILRTDYIFNPVDSEPQSIIFTLANEHNDSLERVIFSGSASMNLARPYISSIGRGVLIQKEPAGAIILY